MARVAEVAAYWDVSPSSVMRLCLRFEEGDPDGLPFIRIGRVVRIRWADVDAYSDPSGKPATMSAVLDRSGARS
jgi:hypothetical protein